MEWVVTSACFQRNLGCGVPRHALGKAYGEGGSRFYNFAGFQSCTSGSSGH